MMKENTNDNYGDLLSLDEAYDSIPLNDDPGIKIPDGTYKVQVRHAILTTSKQGNRMLVWKLKIIGPTMQGAIIWKRNMIVSTSNLKWLKTDLAICGLTLKKLSDLPLNLNRLHNLTLEVTQTTQNNYANNYVDVYFNKLIEADQDTQNTKIDDIPF